MAAFVVKFQLVGRDQGVDLTVKVNAVLYL